MAKHKISFAIKSSATLPISDSDIVTKLYELSDTLHFHITKLRCSKRYDGVQFGMEYKCQMARAQTIVQDIVKAMGPQAFDWEIYE